MPLPQQSLPTSQDAIALLDDLIPLQGASHADVVEYLVEVPLQYSQCLARLEDGRKVPLSQARKFIGWAGESTDRALLFRCKESTLELGLTDRDAPSPGRIRSIIFEVLGPRCAKTMKKFTGVDGGLVYQPAT